MAAQSILGRAGFAVPLSTAEWIGAIGVQLAPLVQAMREDLLGRRVLHADETPVAMLKPGLGKTCRHESNAAECCHCYKVASGRFFINTIWRSNVSAQV